MTLVPGLVEYAFELQAPTVSNPPRTAGSGSRKAWRLRQSPLRGRLQHSGLPKLVALVLENRGVGSNADAQRFMGGRESGFSDPFRIPGFETTLTLLRGALAERRSISVYGDFDVDGITSTAILTETLRALGGEVTPYIPNREREGYGLNKRAIDSLADRGVEVLVTCDCGTTASPEVEHAHGLGLDVVVVDHHVPPSQLPQTSALLNPKLPHEDDLTEFSSAGLAFQLAEALYESQGQPFPEPRYAELAALGTVADMVPLVDENRELVRRGLSAFAESERPGLQALVEVAGAQLSSVSSETIAFGLAPRLNAAGRLADARLALDLLLTQDEAEALALAGNIDALNRERQRMTQEAQKLALEMAQDRDAAPLTVVGHPDFHQGIIGLVASRLVETLGRPAAVYQQGEVESRGSCRSIPEYDITAGLRSCGDLFERFGGHSQAGGFTIRSERLEEFEQRLLEHAARELDGHDLAPVLDIDAEWPLNELRSQEIRWLGKLAPHGQGNPDPTLLSRKVTVVEAKTVGADGAHMRLKLKSGAVSWPAIAFRWDRELPEAGSCVDVVYSLSADSYGPSDNGGALQLTVLDLTPAS